MFISKKKHREIVEQRVQEEREKLYMERRLSDLSRELYSEVGRLETMIRDIERRVMEHMEGNKHAKTD